MKVQSKSGQRGITFVGLVFVGAVVASAGVIAAQVFPTFVEYQSVICLLYTSPSPRDRTRSRMPSSA